MPGDLITAMSSRSKAHERRRDATVAELSECPGVERTPTPTNFSVFLREQYELSPNILIPSHDICPRNIGSFIYRNKFARSPTSRFFLRYKLTSTHVSIVCATKVDTFDRDRALMHIDDDLFPNDLPTSYQQFPPTISEIAISAIELEINKDWNYIKILQWRHMLRSEDPNQIALGKQALALLCEFALLLYSSIFAKLFCGFALYLDAEDWEIDHEECAYLQAIGFESDERFIGWIFKNK